MARRRPVSAERGDRGLRAHAARRSTRPHPAAPAGAESVRAAPGGAATPGGADRRRLAGRDGCGPARGHRLARGVRSAPPDGGAVRIARHPGVGPALDRRHRGRLRPARGALARRAGTRRLLRAPDHGPARRARRRPAVGAHRPERPLRRRRRAHRPRTGFHGLPAGDGGFRHHRQPDRLRGPGSAHSPRAGGRAAGRPVAATGGGRGAAPVHQPGQPRQRPVHRRGRAHWRRGDPGGRVGFSRDQFRPPGPRAIPRSGSPRPRP